MHQPCWCYFSAPICRSTTNLYAFVFCRF